MDELQIFKNEKFGEIRTVMIDGEIWFVGKDVASALQYKDTSDALKKHIDNEDKLTRRFADSGQFREMYVINESGLYALIFGSKLDKAKEFKHWVTSEVLPSIRKTGSYSANQVNVNFSPSPSETMKVGEAVKMGEFLWKLTLASGGTMNQVVEAVRFMWESHGFRFPPMLTGLFAPEQTSMFRAMGEGKAMTA